MLQQMENYVLSLLLMAGKTEKLYGLCFPDLLQIENLYGLCFPDLLQIENLYGLRFPGLLQTQTGIGLHRLKAGKWISASSLQFPGVLTGENGVGKWDQKRRKREKTDGDDDRCC